MNIYLQSDLLIHQQQLHTQVLTFYKIHTLVQNKNFTLYQKQFNIHIHQDTYTYYYFQKENGQFLNNQKIFFFRGRGRGKVITKQKC